MKKTSLIGHLVELLDSVRNLTHPADNVVKGFFRSRHYLGSKDRLFISDALYSILRNFTLLRVYIEETLLTIEARHPTDLPPSLALYAALAVKLRAENPSALLPDIAALWRSYVSNIECSAFLNALKNVEIPSAISQNTASRVAVSNSIPEAIVQEWIDRYGFREAEQLCMALNQPAPITVRVNTSKVSVEECRLELEKEGIKSTPTLHSPYGLILERRINAQSHASFKQGFFEMQDEGSQLISMLLEPTPGETVVDACAGGGGKSLHIAAMMRNAGSLYSVEVNEKRLRNIRDRIGRAGASIIRVCLTDRDKKTMRALHGKADKVLIDSPCSGIGTFRRNPGAKLFFTVESVERMTEIQRLVLERYSELVKPGGRLVYSTCTLLRKENEDVVEWFLSRHQDFVPLPATDILKRQGIQIDSKSHFLTLLPHRTSTDGFFAAIMERRTPAR
ncbi:MAG: RsmB/NOP family class I SAM-dependent RNA methyltransferase [Ignavibacteriae bacterium]|nr:RsmB/NOP family class I SAM-dependent RNA methyltransferase [Ignavibacteriota bacterium]